MIRHKFNSPIDDEGAPAGVVKPSNWNDEHDVDGLLGALVDLGVQPGAFPYLDAAGNGALAPLSDVMRGLMALTSAPAILAAIGGVGPASPAFTGAPTAPTPGAGDNSTKLATTAFVAAAIATVLGSAPAALDTLNELAAALGNDANFASTVTNALALKAPLNSPALTGAPTAPTVAGSTDSTTKIATTAFVQAVILALATVARTGAYADLSGKPTLGTAAALNVGTLANQIVQLDGSAKLPAVDGSALTNVAATNVTLSSGRLSLGANVALTVAGNNFDILQQTLGVGTYAVFGKASVKDPAASIAVAARLYDGTTVLDDSGYVHTATGTARSQICCFGILTVATGTKTVKLQVKNATTANGVVLANETGDGGETSLFWVKIAA
ncbi:MAG: hypothetical protein ACOY3N_23205 [Bradyrhizobium sp.]|uniref:hypothetical protein n=1 Tax=Bradyrhizobium sp. TaxID=376 RepID=UPI003BF244FE